MLSTLVERIADAGGTVAAIDLGIDPTTPIGKFARTLMLALAEMERERIHSGDGTVLYRGSAANSWLALPRTCQ